jgi:hypothetical protein
MSVNAETLKGGIPNQAKGAILKIKMTLELQG